MLNSKAKQFLSIMSRSKRSLEFEEQTEKGSYHYWLNQEDIADIGRIAYDNYKAKDSSGSEFEIVGSIAQLQEQIIQCKSRYEQSSKQRLTVILNLGNLHWVTLVLYLHAGDRVAYYVDSKGNPLPDNYNELLREQGIRVVDLQTGIQQQDAYNCGLWALENAKDLNDMLDDSSKSLILVVTQLKRPRDKSYFQTRRQTLTASLRADMERNNLERVSINRNELKTGSEISGESQVSGNKPRKRSRIAGVQESDIKQLKFDQQERKLTAQVETFVEAFINECAKRVAAAHVVARVQKLTMEGLITELKTSSMAGLFGCSVVQSLAGSVPAIVGFVKTMGGHLVIPKSKARIITRAFSNVPKNSLSEVLAEAALAIFKSFEAQFSQITDKAGDSIAMEKLAEDASSRLMNYVAKNWHDELITQEFITKGILIGESQKYFSPSVKKLRLRVTAHFVQDKQGNDVNTANLYEKTGLVLRKEDQDLLFFKKISNQPDSTKYGYRRILSWEQNEEGDLKFDEQQNYEQETIIRQETAFQRYAKDYNYYLKEIDIQEKASNILKKIDNKYFDLPVKETLKHSILFDLRKPVDNFTGREMTLDKLHDTLMLGGTATVVARLASLSLNPTSRLSITSSQASLSGLGGVGKTQLALRYAALHAADYDHNVIWIDSETKSELKNSFQKLATKLDIYIKDKYGVEKDIENLIEEIYEYFSDRKSLFIFDNVENYQAIVSFLPKAMLGNSPTLLITSRYTNWQNIAEMIYLDVFTESETLALVKKELNLDETQDKAIKELNQLVQGLPLALQQAIAYIRNRKLIGQFEVKDYNELFRRKDQALELLNFNFWEHTNDPYLKTVYTTWSITLEKILLEDKVAAIDLLEMMAYMSPDGINSYLFLTLYLPQDLMSAFSLLKDYSLVDVGKYEGQFLIHRLLQKVVAIRLERDQTRFFNVASKVERLLREHRSNSEVRAQYLHFILYADNFHLKLSNPTLTSLVSPTPTFKKFFDLLSDRSQDDFLYFFDIARLEFEKQKYMDFLTEGLFYFNRLSRDDLISVLITYFEELKEKGFFTIADIQRILDKKAILGNYFGHHRARYVRRPEKKTALINIAFQLTSFRRRLQQEQELLNCDSMTRKKRSTRCLLLDEKENIQNQAKYKHLQTVNRIATFISTGLFAKDMFSDLLKGDFDAVVDNFKLLLGSIVLGKISNKLLTMGEILTADEGLLLNKEVLLENKIALLILFNENIISPVTRRALGKRIKVLSRFIEKGISAVLLNDFINEFEAYLKGNSSVLPSLVSTGIIVGVDGVEIGIEGAEFLGWISGVSALTGPLGEGITSLVWLGAEAYQVKKTVEEIEKYAHLTTTQAFTEGMRAFFNLDLSDDIQTKINNNQILQKAIDFLKQHPEIKRYIFPAYVSAQEVHLPSRAYLDKKFNITLSETMPDDPKEGNLICLSGTPTQYLDSTILLPTLLSLEGYVTKTDIYLCEKVIGLEYIGNRTGDATLIALGPGDNEVLVSSNSSTFTILNNGRKYNRVDNGFFILQGNNITGVLKGGKGINLVMLNDFHPSDSEFILLSRDGFLCGKKNEGVMDKPLLCDTDKGVLRLENIHYIYGRKNEKDIFYVNENMIFVDNYGGKTQKDPDYTYIMKAHKALQIVLRSHSMVLFDSNANITACDYKIPRDQVGETGVQLAFSGEGQHRFFFEADLEDLDAIVIGNHRIIFNVFSSRNITEHENLFSVIISDADYIKSQDNNLTTLDIQFPRQAYYLLADGTEIKFLEKGSLYAKQRTNKSLETILQDYPTIAQRLKMMLSIEHINSQNETELVLIGNDSHEILYNDPQLKSHLIGNGGKNSYSITSAPNTTDSFPIEVILYSKRNMTTEFFDDWIDILDLRPLVKNFKKKCSEQRILPSVMQNGTDLIIKLDALYCPLENPSIASTGVWNLATVRLYRAVTENWYQNLDILFKTQHPMGIVHTDANTWELLTSPLVFDDNKDIMFIKNGDIAKGSEIIFFKDIGNYTFLCRNKTDLVITNIRDANTTSLFNPHSILFSQFYELDEMKETALSLTLLFFDQEIVMKEHEDQINNATEFFSVFQQYQNQTLQNSFNATAETILQPSNLQSSFDRTRRSKRQVAEADDNDRMSLSIDANQEYDPRAEHYLEKYEAKEIKKNHSRTRSLRVKMINRKKEIIALDDQAESKKLDFVNNKTISHLHKKKMIYGVNRYDVYSKAKTTSFLSSRETLPVMKKMRSKEKIIYSNSNFSRLQLFTEQHSFLGNTERKQLGIEKGQKPVLFSNPVLLGSSQKENKEGTRRNRYERVASSNLNNTLFFINFLIQKSSQNQLPVVKQKVLKNVRKLEKQQEQQIRRIGLRL